MKQFSPRTQIKIVNSLEMRKQSTIVLTAREFAKMCGISFSTAYRYHEYLMTKKFKVGKKDLIGVMNERSGYIIACTKSAGVYLFHIRSIDDM